jgi:Helix-turn-helix family
MTARARSIWRLIEPIHAVTYFAPSSLDRIAELGTKGFWMGYFATRSAPLGAANPAVVEAVVYNFSPRLVYRALPDAWSYTTPEAAIDARIVSGSHPRRSPLGTGTACTRGCCGPSRRDRRPRGGRSRRPRSAARAARTCPSPGPRTATRSWARRPSTWSRRLHPEDPPVCPTGLAGAAAPASPGCALSPPLHAV